MLTISNKEQVFKILAENKETLKKFQVKQIGLFGSYANGTASANSDLDFVFEFENISKNFDNFMELSFFFEEIFGKKVDLLTKEGLHAIRVKNVAERIMRSIVYG